MKTKRLVFLGTLLLIILLFTGCGMLGGGEEKTGKKVTFTESMITRNPTSGTGMYVYTGEPITYNENDFSFEVNGKYPKASDFTFTYENNVNVGNKTAKLTITAKDSNPYCKGSVTLYFSIAAAGAEARDKASLISYLSNDNYDSIRLDSDITVDENETLVIPGAHTVATSGNHTLTINGTLRIEGNLSVNGTTYSQGNVTKGLLINNGVIENSGQLKISNLGEFINNGAVRSTGTITNAGKVYTRDLALPGIESDSGVQYVRTPLTEENITLPYLKENGEEYPQTPGYVRPAVVIDHNAPCTVTYTDNDRVGTATVTVTAEEKDEYFYGSASKTFTIIPGVATVSDYAQLAAAKASGNFNRYEVTDTVILPEDASFTLGAEEKLNFAKAESKLYINGTFVNNGVITAQSPYTNSYTGVTTINTFSLAITVGENGSYSDTGTLSSEKVSVSNNGAFTLSMPEPIAFVSFISSKGEITVNSDFSVPSLSIGQNTSLVIGENGSVSCHNVTSSSTITNAGTLSISGQLYLYAAAQIFNSGTLTLGEETIVYDMKWTNTGTIVNNGDVIINALTTFVNTENGFDNTNGHVWTYDALDCLSENVTMKTTLSAENVTLEYTEVPYTGERKVPTFTINGETINVSDFLIYVYDYNDEVVYTTNSKHAKYLAAYPRQVGTYTISIRTNNSKCPYGGTLDLTYRIKKGTCLLENQSSFNRVIENTNYERIVLMTNVVTGGTINYIATRTLARDITLDTNGYSISLTYTNFHINGTLVLSAPTDDRVYSLHLKGTSNLRNHNTIVNNGVLLFDSSAESYLYDSNVSFLNNGTVYAGTTFTDDLVESESTGVIYRRNTISDTDLSLEYTETFFDETEKTPVVSYIGTLITNEVFQTFDISYVNNYYAGSASVVVKPNITNERYYGSVTLPFTIKKASKLVTTLHSEDFEDIDNYYEVRLANDYVSSEDIIVPDGIALNFSLYSLTFTSDKVLLVFDGAILRAEADTKSTFIKNYNNVHEIKLLSDITEKIEVNFSSPETFIKNGYYNYNSQLSSRKLDIKTLDIDMNGYSMTGGFRIITNSKTYTNPYFTLNIVNSRAAEQASVIGNVADTEYGFVQSYNGNMGERIVVNMTDITVAGIQIEGHNVGRGIQLNAVDCVIQTAGTYALDNPSNSYYINADSSFTDCTFSAAGINGKIVHLYSGEHTFTGCNLNLSQIDARTEGTHRAVVEIVG